MKSLKESIFSDVEDIANDDTVLIEQFLKDNYNIRGTYPKEVGGWFDCSNCSILKISDQDRKKYKIVT